MNKNNKKYSADMFDFDIENAVSVTECTGLISQAPHTSEELAAYNDILNYSPLSADMAEYTEKSQSNNGKTRA